jgi:pimeloyl-ACP methyl ester carboxylesterase
MHTLFQSIWTDWRNGLAIAALLSAAAGLISAWLTPRGPVNSFQALLSMAVALFIGTAAGFVMKSRWSILVTPLVFMIVYEIARNGFDGPTVDMIHLSSTYGVIAFVVGRLVHAFLVLTPMILGVLIGTEFTARLSTDTSQQLGTLGWIFTSLAALMLILLAISVARPATTHPILGSDGKPLPGSVAEIISVPIGGHDQTMMIRGRSINSPILLYLAGGPGGTDLGAMRADVSLEQDFIVVTWEQRGVGKSYGALDPAETLTLEQMVADTIEVTNYLRTRFNQDKIYLVGNSWGTILGALVVQQQPELFHAFVGTGQMVSPRETDIMFWEDTLVWAEKTGNQKLAATLRKNGPPPYANLLYYEPAISHEHDWNAYPYLDTSKEMPANLFVPENSLMDRINGLRSFLDTFSVLYPQLQEIDFRKDITSLQVPVYLVMGKYEARGRAVLAQEWYEILNAPTKDMIIFEHSGHRPLFEEPADFSEVMQHVLENSDKHAISVFK